MQKIEEMLIGLEKILSKERYQHSIRVMNTCENLGRIYGADVQKVKIAGLLHDCARELSRQELIDIVKKNGQVISVVEDLQTVLLHAKAGGAFARDHFGVLDKEIISAISLHTTGKPNMSLVEKILFIADFIEPNRNFSGIDEIRNMAYNDIDKTLIVVLKNIIMYVVENGFLLHTSTVEAYNWAKVNRRG